MAFQRFQGSPKADFVQMNDQVNRTAATSSRRASLRLPDPAAQMLS
jgi:hypothetical protein